MAEKMKGFAMLGIGKVGWIEKDIPECTHVFHGWDHIGGDFFMKLSERLKMVCNMVSPGYSVCDVGCDHAFTPICLVKNKKSPGCKRGTYSEGEGAHCG